jgi:Spy/CpxP family protein refolding chaperone
MTKTRIIVIVGFLIAFGAGAVVGLQLRTTPVRATEQPMQEQRPSWLRSELNLTAEQNEQMKNIWEGLHNSGRGYEDRRRRLRDERDEAIAALLAPSVMGDYDRILQDFSNKLTAMAQERDKAFAAAVEKTKTILTAEQRAKYEEFLKRREPDRGDRGPRGSGRRPESRPATRPVVE